MTPTSSRPCLWAAGVHVNNVPDNLNPARILNMSFGSSDETCPQSYQDVIQQVTALGVVVVVSAGNEGGPVDTPGNCAGVVAVAGLRQVGTKVGFSSLGAEVTLSAPAGNCVNTTTGSPCLYSILTTTNTGTTVTADQHLHRYVRRGESRHQLLRAGGQRHRGPDGKRQSEPEQLPDDGRLREGAQPFPQFSAGESPQPPMCHVPTGASDIQTAECVCTLDGQDLWAPAWPMRAQPWPQPCADRGRCGQYRQRHRGACCHGQRSRAESHFERLSMACRTRRHCQSARCRRCHGNCRAAFLRPGHGGTDRDG